MSKRYIEYIMSFLLLISSFGLFACGTFQNKNTLEESTGDFHSTTVEESSSVASTGWTVALDAGHGASDSGKVGVNGALEKDINLNIVYFLKNELEQRGVAVVLTRTSDAPLYSDSDHNKKMADMKKRIAMIADSNVDLVVSIHQNSYPDEAVKGPQVFYYTASQEGEQLATILQKSFDLVVGEEQNRRLAKANGDYYLLLHTPCACVIVECGFLSNWEEAELLVNQDYQKQMAAAIAEGIIKYLTH